MTRGPRPPAAESPPFPGGYSAAIRAGDGAALAVRSIRADDEPALARFHETLSADTVYFRYLHPIKLRARVAHERLLGICRPDPRTDAVVVALETAASGAENIVAVGRLGREPGGAEAEFALLVADPHQHRGIGAALLRCLLELARAARLERVTGAIHFENAAMLSLARKLGFQLSAPADSVWKAEIHLRSACAGPRLSHRSAPH